MKEAILIHKADNVAVALRDFAAGETLSVEGGRSVVLKEPVASGHKAALTPIAQGADIIKYGMPIGLATAPIESGRAVHTHNIKTRLKEQIAYIYAPQEPKPLQTPYAPRKLYAYKRENGQIGIRNELWIVPTVGCLNGIAQKIIKEFSQENDISGIDGINVLSHPYGCSQLGEDHENTKKILQNAAMHPNAGGVLVFALGCENNQMDQFKATLGPYNAQRARFLIAQEADDEISAAKALLKELLAVMQNDRREEVPISALKVGLKCGGSDGFSGITANPLIGEFSDYIVANGGASALTEVPEMFGAETLLMERSASRFVFDKIVAMINGFKGYFIANNQEIYENPSPGNKKGGISTLEDKSMGCTQKAGGAPIADVLEYGQRLQAPGLNLLSAPGNDLVAVSALAAAGCHLVLFSTGRGNPYGGFVPTVKIATNSALAERKAGWIDFDAGMLLNEDTTREAAVNAFIDCVFAVANGQKAKNELNNFQELAIFKTGVTL